MLVADLLPSYAIEVECDKRRVQLLYHLRVGARVLRQSPGLPHVQERVSQRFLL